jgi:hypothetical protein
MLSDKPRKKIQYGMKLAVSFAQADVELIREHTFADPKLLGLGVAKGGTITGQLSLADIEELQGYVAAQANRSKAGKLPKKLYHVYDYLQTFLDTYDDQPDLLRRTGVCEGD